MEDSIKEGDTSGYLYFIKCKKQPFVKIGYTYSTPEQRLSQLQVGNPEELELVKAFIVSEPEYAEKLAHKDLKLYRKRGEWFELELDRLLSYIEAFEESRLPDLK